MATVNQQSAQNPIPMPSARAAPWVWERYWNAQNNVGALQERQLRMQALNAELEQRGLQMQQTRFQLKALKDQLQRQSNLMANLKDRPLLQSLVGTEGVGATIQLGMAMEQHKAAMGQIEEDKKLLDDFMGQLSSFRAGKAAEEADRFSEEVVTALGLKAEREFGLPLPEGLRASFKRRVMGAHQRGRSEEDILRGIQQMLPGWMDEARNTLAATTYGPPLLPGVDPITGRPAPTPAVGFVEQAASRFPPGVPSSALFQPSSLYQR